MEGERIYTVPLRKEWLNVSRWRRTKRAVAGLRAFLLKHTKAKEVKLDRWVNEALWAKGAKNPPSRITVKVKVEKEIAIAELATLPPRAKRIAEAQKTISESTKKKEEIKKAKEEDKKKAEDYKKKKEEDKKALEEAKRKEEDKKKAQVTKQQEIAMHK